MNYVERIECWQSGEAYSVVDAVAGAYPAGDFPEVHYDLAKIRGDTFSAKGIGLDIGFNQKINSNINFSLVKYTIRISSFCIISLFPIACSRCVFPNPGLL